MENVWMACNTKTFTQIDKCGQWKHKRTRSANLIYRKRSVAQNKRLLSHRNENIIYTSFRLNDCVTPHILMKSINRQCFVTTFLFLFALFFSDKLSRWLYWKKAVTKKMSYSMSIWVNRKWSEVIVKSFIIHQSANVPIVRKQFFFFKFIYHLWGFTISNDSANFEFCSTLDVRE